MWSKKAVEGAETDRVLSLHSGQSMAYQERNTSMNKQLAKESQKKRHKLFEKRSAQQKKGGGSTRRVD